MRVAERLAALGLAPHKRFGQNFLTDDAVADRIAAAAAEGAGTVLEIGPGLGVLTERLAARAGVVAIELDRGLAAALRAHLPPEVALVEGDALEVDWLAALDGRPKPWVIAGNVPYSVTGALLRRATAVGGHVGRVVFMIQREVADRLGARPGADAYGALSVFVQARFQVERVLDVGSGAFHPRPKVASAVVRLTPLSPPRAEETDAFRELVRRAFGARRKTLRNAWRGVFGWTDQELETAARAAGIDLAARGETLAVEAFAALAR